MTKPAQNYNSRLSPIDCRAETKRDNKSSITSRMDSRIKAPAQVSTSRACQARARPPQPWKSSAIWKRSTSFRSYLSTLCSCRTQTWSTRSFTRRSLAIKLPLQARLSSSTSSLRSATRPSFSPMLWTRAPGSQSFRRKSRGRRWIELRLWGSYW